MTLCVRFNGSDTSLATSTNVPTLNNGTLCITAKVSVDRDTYSGIFVFNGSVGGQPGPHLLATESDGTTVVVWDSDNNVAVTAQNMVVGTWYFFAFVMNGTSVKVYYGPAGGNATKLTLVTGTLGGVGQYNVGSMRFGAGPGSGEAWNGCLQGARWFTTELTASEIESERNSLTPVKQSNIHGAWLFDTAASNGTVADASGNGKTLTYGSGTIANETGFNMQHRDGVRNLGVFWG